jgi:hypothetical protein
VYVTPLIELAVKGLLLSKLKADIDCNLDPRIPFQYREDKGVMIDVRSIDSYGLLQTSPMEEQGQYKYFGTKCYYTLKGENDKYYKYDEAVKACQEKGKDATAIEKYSEIDDIYELLRAKDMNAFLWFIIHKARFVNPNDGLPDSLKSKYSVINAIVDEIVTNNEYIGVGTQYSNNNLLSVCIKSEPQYKKSGEAEYPTSHVSSKQPSNNDIAELALQQETNIENYKVTIVPTSNKWNGANWYVDRRKYLNNLGYNESNVERDYDKEFALFRLHCEDEYNKKLVFAIKPAPTTINRAIKIDVLKTPTSASKTKLEITYGEGNPMLNYYVILFNSDGKKDLFGKYSVRIDSIDSNIQNSEYDFYKIKKVSNVWLKVSKKNLFDYELYSSSSEGTNIRDVLFECYPGLTIYEFNYDFIMGMQLFDATVITAQVIENLTNIKLGRVVSKSSTEHQIRISEIVKKIINSDGNEVTDCFYSFSNKEYDKMANEAEMKRASLYPFQDSRYKAVDVSNLDVYGTLNEYNAQSTLEEKINVIKKTIRNASGFSAKDILPEDIYNNQLNFIENAIEMLVTVFVEALFTPKLLLILTINSQMMGNTVSFNIEDFLKQFQGLIYSLIEQIRDILLQRLMDFVKEKLEKLLNKTVALLTLEQVEYYMRLMSLLLRSCTFSFPKNPNLPTMLDYVDYADIDENEQPINNEC